MGCRRDSDCTFDKACVSSRCVNPCDVQDPCGRNADCRPIVHRPHCSCKSGFEGNPNDYCKKGLFQILKFYIVMKCFEKNYLGSYHKNFNLELFL